MSYLKSTSVVGGMTLLSRVFGLIRDVVFARAFGAGPILDTFFIAFKIPNLLRRFFAEGAFSQAFVPVIGEYRERRTQEAVRALVAAAGGTLGGALLVVTVAGVLAAPVIIAIFAPGFLDEPDKFDLTVSMLRLTFPYLLFISLTALAGGILNTYGRFGPPAFTPVLLNLVLIAFALWVAPHAPRPGLALALGVFIAGLAQLLFQLPFLAALRMLPRPRWAPRDEGVRRIGRLMLPAIFGSSVAQINLLFDTLIASFLVTGSITWLYMSDRLMEFPLGVFGIALSTVILPGLSRQHAQSSPLEFSSTMDWALRLAVVVGLPAAAGLFVLATPMLTTIFQYGEFSGGDVEMSAYALMAYAAGLMGFILVKVFAPGFFARQDTRTPVRVAVIALIVNMALNVAFVVPMVIWEFPAPHMGLALATACSAFLNALLLYVGLRRRDVYVPRAGWPLLLARVAIANLIMIAVLTYYRGSAADWLVLDALDRAWRLAALIGAGALSYFLVLAVIGLRPSHLRVKSPGAAV